MKTLSPFVATPPALPAQPKPAPSRSRFVTMLGWITAAISALLLPISLITLLMIIAGSQGTQSGTVSGFISVVLRPPATLIAGIGLLRRWRWSYSYSLALLASFAMWHVTLMVRGPVPEHTYTSPGGVPTTVLASSVDYPLHLAALTLTLGVFFKLRTRSVRAEFGYGLPPTGHARSANAPTRPRSNSSTSSSPISKFIRAIFQRGQEKRSHTAVFLDATMIPDARDISPSVQAAKRLSQRRALLTAITVMAAIAMGTGWLVHRGLATGETYSPAKRASQQRNVQRSQEPVFFWMSISVYALLSAGSASLAAWGVRETFRPQAVNRDHPRPEDPSRPW